MNIGQAYLNFLQLVNRNLTNDNANVDKSRFIILYNNIQNRFIEWTLEKRNEDDLRDVQKLLTLDKKLNFDSLTLNHYDFKLPTDYFDHSAIQVFGSKGNCKKIKIETTELKNDNSEEYLADSSNIPSFEFRDTFYTINANKIAVYVDDFKIDEVYLSYYRNPVQVDISGYIDIDGNPSSNINPEFTDRIVNRILLAMAKEHSAINEEFNKYQVDKDRLFSEV